MEGKDTQVEKREILSNQFSNAKETAEKARKLEKSWQRPILMLKVAEETIATLITRALNESMAAIGMFSWLLKVDDGFDAEALKLADHVVFEDVDRVRTRNSHNLICKRKKLLVGLQE